MQQKYQYKQFIFNKLPQSSIEALNCILVYIEEAVRCCGNFKNIVLRSKWILTELFTNASKHSDDDTICFEVKIENAILQITKSDTGRSFSFVNDGQRKSFPDDFNEKETYWLSKDDLSILQAKVCGSTLYFTAEDNTDTTGISIQEIHEHFGLIIIARSSDTFMYAYDSCTKTNIFTANLILQY